MHTALKQRIETMRARMEGRAPVAEIHVSSQLFVSPDPVCARLVDLAGLHDSDLILEPSAGTGAILRAVLAVAPGATCEAVELNGGLYQHLIREFPGVGATCGDFLQFAPPTRYSKILMNPPFRNAQDIAHIRHALTLLESGGVLTAVCLNGPRQEKALWDLCDFREVLPRGTFTYTDVSTAIIRIVAD